MWQIFDEELWARFGLMECDNFDEAVYELVKWAPFVITRWSLKGWQSRTWMDTEGINRIL